MEEPTIEAIKKYSTYSMSELKAERDRLIEFREDTEDIREYINWRKSG